MSLNEYDRAVTTDFRGPRKRIEQTDLPSTSAIEAVNVEYEAGHWRTRFGLGAAWNPAEAISTMFNWQKGADAISANGNYLVYHNPITGKTRYVAGLTSFTPVDLFTVSGAYGANHAEAGTRLYTALFNAAGEGHAECRVSSGFDAVGTVTTDKAFPAPMTAVPTVTEVASAGVCTAGQHRVGYYILSRTGHRGKLSPHSSGAYAPVTVTCTGSRIIRFSLNTTWPADATAIFLVMSPASNLNNHVAIPGATVSVTGGATSTVVIDVSISDDDLISAAKATLGTPVIDYQYWMTQDGSGNGPFSPSHVFPVGSRMAYLTKLSGVSEIYFSEPGQFQQITADRHVVRLPGAKRMTTAFASPTGAVYLLGPSWTYATQSSGEKPINWPEPRLIDGRIGTPSPTGADVNPSRGFAWVADEGGLYLFEAGQYRPKPISYEVESDWKRINWTYPHLVKVKDDKDRNRVFVSAPIDASTAANALFMFDYSQGVEPEEIRYAYWTVDNYFQAAMEMVYNPTTKRRELWLGSAFASGVPIVGKVLRQKNAVDDGSPYNDDGNSISWIYETAPFPSDPIGINAHHMMRMRAKGSGNVTMTVYKLDHVASAGPFTIPLSTAPNNDVMQQFFLEDTPAVTYRYVANTTDTYMLLSKLESYYKEFSKL